MRKIDFPLIADVLFYSFGTFLLSLALLRYFRVAYGIALAAAILIGLAVGGMVFLLIYTRHRKRALSKKEREKRDALLLHLALERDERVQDALVTALSADGKEAHADGDEISADGETLVPLFTMQPVNADEIARQIRKHAGEPFTLLCNALTPEAEKLLASFGLKAVRGDEVFALFERTGTTPDPLICGEIPRVTAKRKLMRAFGKRNARPFFVSGLLLLFMSLFALFPLYYLITGSVLILCSIGVRAFGYA